MTGVPLRLGPLDFGGQPILRSGLRWLCPDGHLFRAGEIVAYCNIAPANGRSDVLPEARFDLQVALAPRSAGRIRRVDAGPSGGYLDRLPTLRWTAETIWARLEECDAADVSAPDLLFLAGRRFADIAGDRSGLLTGWHDRARAWWGEGAGGTLLAAGICELEAIFRGDDGSFGAMFEQVGGPAHIVLSQGEPLVPCAAVLAEQLTRTPRDVAAIRHDFARSFASGTHAPAAEEWVFAGALLNAIERCPITEDYQLLTRAGSHRTGPAAAICLSLTAEMRHVARHRRLGYTLNFHGFRLAALGPALGEWLKRDFEIVPRTIDHVAADYRRLIAAAPGRTFFVINRVSSQLYEHVQSYEGLDDATFRRIATVRAKELNLMLHDLARAPNVEVVDADAIVAKLGMRRHLPDGVHGSGALYGEIRAELLRLVQRHRLPGFAPRLVSRS